MLKYRSHLKTNSRRLRKETTKYELKLWNKIRRKQILDLQFYRQKPIGDYIVDFYCPKVKLVIEIDGDQHSFEGNLEDDQKRDKDLEDLGLTVLRFTNYQIWKEFEIVMNEIYLFCAKVLEE